MTNLQKAAEQGNQAAPNILEAIKAGEIGGGNSNSQIRNYVKAIANSEQDLETLVARILEERTDANILGFAGFQSRVFVYSNYKDWLDPLILRMNAYIEFLRSAGADEEQIAQYLEILNYIESAKTSIPLNTVYELSDDGSFIITELASINAFPTLGTMTTCTLEDNDVYALSVFKLGTVFDLDFPIETPLFLTGAYMPISPLYLNSHYGTNAVTGYGNSRVCYVDAGDSYDQIIANISDRPDAPYIIRSSDATRYDAFIIKGVSNGVAATLACIYSLEILSVIEEDELSSELQTKLAAYKASVEAEPNKYVCTSDADLCKHIEACSCILKTQNEGYSVFGPCTRENVIRRVVSSNGSDAYSYISTSQLFAEDLFAESDYFTSSGSGTNVYYMPSPLK